MSKLQMLRLGPAFRASLVAAALSLVFTPNHQRVDTPGVRAVAAAIETLRFRINDARLSIDVAYRPIGDRREALSNVPFLQAAARLDEETVIDLAHARAMAIASLYIGRAEKAADDLRNTLNASGRKEAALWNDLAVAELDRVTSQDRRTLIDALEAAETAYALDRRFLPTLWTRAVLLERLSCRAAAAKAWTEYLRCDPSSQWSVEARARLARITRVDSQTTYDSKILRDSLKRGDTDRIRALIVAFPREARLFGEDELLTEWAQTVSRRAPAEEIQNEVRQLAMGFRDSTGESFFADVAAELQSSNIELAFAILQYHAARERFLDGAARSARESFAVAEAALSKMRSPLTVLANIYHASSVYRENRFGDVLTVLDPALDPCVPERRYYAACGLRNWVAGLALVQTGEPSASVQRYAVALKAFGKARETESVAGVLTLRSESLDFMSAMDEAWADRLTALTMFAQQPIGKRPLVWMTVALAALRDHRDRAAAVLLSAIESDAGERGDALWLAESKIWSAVARQRIEGSVSDASVEEIRAAVERISDPAIRARSYANLAMVLAEIRGSTPATRGDLDQALEFYRSASDQFNRTTALTQRAEIRAAAKEFEHADADVVSALEEFRRQAEGIADPFMRTLFSDRSRGLFVTASRLEAMRGHAAAALWLSERARSVALWALPETVSTTPLKASAEQRGDELVRSLPPEWTIVHQDLDGDLLRTWLIRDGHLRFVETTVNAGSLQSQILAFRRKLQEPADPSSIIPQARALYRTLLEPLRGALDDVSLLVYSPSAELRGVPINALHDGRQFLIEKTIVATTRSLRTLAKSRRRVFGSDTRILITCASAPGSPELPGAKGETAALRRQYGDRAFVLSGAAATRKAFLEASVRYDVIHLAAHGLADSRPLQSSMLLGEDRLRAYDVMTHPLPRAPLVILAGCSTDDSTSGHTTLSLANAFEAAGATAVVGALWDVPDDSTQRFLEGFHEQLASGIFVERALNAAQRQALRDGDVSVWAGFQLQW